MDLAPAHCRTCGHIYLESVIVIAADNVVCECGGIARVLSDARYRHQEESLFDAIVASLVAGGVSCLTAPRLSRALDGAPADRPGAALSRLAVLLPSLAVIELIAGGDETTARTAESMFGVVLDAIASTRSHSGFMPAAAAKAGGGD